MAALNDAPPVDVNLAMRLAQFETMIEATAPPPANPCTCLCLRCAESRNRRAS